MISVVVPVYKVEQYLNRCVDSIMNQTYKDFELILVDDGSPDSCPQMCDELAKKHSNIVVIHQKNGGLSAARNTGIEWSLENSDSEWITFIDSDDWIHPQYLELLLKANTLNDTDISLCEVCVTAEYVLDQELVEDCSITINKTETAFVNSRLIANAAWARLYKKTLFKDIRYPVGKIHEDRFTTYKLLFLYEKVSVVNAPLLYYFVNNEGIVRSKWNLRRLDNLEACENQLEFFKITNNDEMYEYILKEYIHLMLYSLRQMKGKKEFAPYEKNVRCKLRKTLRTHKKMLGLSFSKDFNTYKYAYPVIAKICNRLGLVNKG